MRPALEPVDIAVIDSNGAETDTLCSDDGSGNRRWPCAIRTNLFRAIAFGRRHVSGE
jgi:hypothetical protein